VGAGLTCQRPIITSGDERIRAATGAHRDSLCLIQAMAGLGARAHWFGRCSVRMDLPWNIKQCHGEYFSLEPYKLIFTFLCVVDILFVDVPCKHILTNRTFACILGSPVIFCHEQGRG
jgi:hypothetical protein